MDHEVKIRLIDKADFEAVLKIYAPYVTNTAITFEYEVPSLDDFSKRLEGITSQYPWFVCEVDGAIAGYAYAYKHRERTAYQWCVESSTYVSEAFQGSGIARWLYNALLGTLELQGYENVYAIVTLPNIKSEKFHLAHGFNELCIYKKIGFKLGRWHDVKWFELCLAEHATVPSTPVSIQTVKSNPGFQKIIETVNLGLKTKGAR